MKGFNKLVLATAIIAASSCSFAMQAMDDDSLSAATGQDGITIKMDTNLSNLTVKWVDRDGIVGDPTYSNAGGVVITPLGIQSTNQVITIDAGGNAGTGVGTQGQLRIGVTMGTLGNAADDTIINLNGTKIRVADAVNVPVGGWTTETLAQRSATGAATDIITFDATAQLRISAGGTLTMLLGNRAAGAHLISVLSDIPSIALTGMSILDGATGPGIGIGIGTLTIDTVHAVAGIDVVAGGLQINTNGTTIGAVGLEQVKLGTLATAASIGDVYISGFTANSIITVTGH
jgi:hypothetical protein